MFVPTGNKRGALFASFLCVCVALFQLRFDAIKSTIIGEEGGHICAIRERIIEIHRLTVLSKNVVAHPK